VPVRERSREWYFWIAATILVAMVVHLGSVYALPRLIMTRALTRMGPPNVMHYGKRPDANSRGIVRPSPDLLYATCPYDLANGPLRVTMRVTHAAYWSVSAFDSATNNFFVRNDRQIAGDRFELVVLRRGQTLPPLAAPESALVFSPSDRGLVLLRSVIDNERHLPALEAVLHQSHCETVAPKGKAR
jgi:uncharacterized membrane protein